MPPEKLLDLKLQLPPELARSVIEAAWLDGMRTGLIAGVLIGLVLVVICCRGSNK